MVSWYGGIMICVVFVIVSNPLLRQLLVCWGLIVTQDDVYTLGRHCETTGQHGLASITRAGQGRGRQHSTLKTDWRAQCHSVKSSLCIVSRGSSTTSLLSSLVQRKCQDMIWQKNHPRLPSALTPETRLDYVSAAPHTFQLTYCPDNWWGGWQPGERQHLRISKCQSPARPGERCENIPHGHPQLLVSLNPQKYSKTTHLI